jgi:outer membrane protein
MKKLQIVLFALLLTLGWQAHAQQRIAHLNVAKILAEMPEYKKAQAELQQLSQNYQKELEQMQKEYFTKLQKYQQEAAQVSKEENQRRAEELKKMEQSIYQAQQRAQQDLAKKEAEKLDSIRKKLMNVVEQVAKEKKFDYVLDSSPPSSVLVAHGPDIYQDVKKKLGL